MSVSCSPWLANNLLTPSVQFKNLSVHMCILRVIVRFLSKM
jgi:hypothetical protein